MDREEMLIRTRPNVLPCLCVAPRATQLTPRQRIHVSGIATSMNHLRRQAYEIGFRFCACPLYMAIQLPPTIIASIWECMAYQQQRCLQGTDGTPFRCVRVSSYKFESRVAQWIRHRLAELGIAGSRPAGVTAILCDAPWQAVVY
jgi:hypothetical protein